MLLLLLANIVCAFFIASSLSAIETQARFISALDVVLVLWATILFAQIAIQLTTGVVFDFHSWIFPFSDVRIGSTGGDLYRLTGHHIEPGTYCAWAYGLAFLRMLLSGKTICPSVAITIASLPLTLSAWGVLAACFFVGSLCLTLIVRREFVKSTAAIFLLIFLAWLSYGDYLQETQEYFSRRGKLQDISGQSKAWVYETFFAGIRNYIFFGENLTYGICNGCLSQQDAGIGINLAIHMGLIALSLVLFTIFRASFSRGGYPLLVVSIPLFFAKFFVWELLFWLIFFVSMLHILLKHRRPIARPC
jgi:hypothetical protein